MKYIVLALAALLLTPLTALHATNTVATASVSPPAHRGLYAIWFDRMPEVLELPYITGAQVVAQWGELETAEGQYDFSGLSTKMKLLHDQHRPFTVQVNGNVKPGWLFDRVPYLPEKLGEQVRDARGTLMYWHPVFEQAYLNFVRTYGRRPPVSPNRQV